MSASRYESGVDTHVGTIEVERSDDVSIVSVAGEHDLSSAPELERCLAAGLDGNASALVVDLSQATFIDSSILRVLIAGRERAHAVMRGFSVQLAASAGAAVRRVIEVTDLGELLSVCSERADAIAAARRGPGSAEPNG